MDSDIIIKSLAGCSFTELYAAHVKAFKDYPFQWDKEALQRTIYRRGFDSGLSFGAFFKNELVSFTWNGTGVFKGLPTAYDTGTGTIEEHRGQGLASKIFEYSIPFLKKAGIQQYVLEVLEENKKAISVYSKQGFTVSRTFDCFRINSAELKHNEKNTLAVLQIKEIDLSFQPEMEAMLDFELSWQNNFAALRKKITDFIILGVFRNDMLIGYGIIEPLSGDIPQLAVIKSERRKGIGKMLVQELAGLNKADILKIINIESCCAPIKKFITTNGIPHIVSQFEMVKMI